MDVNSWGNSE